MANLVNYIKKIWKDAPSTDTPINAENLNHMEDGIYNNATAINTLNSDLGSKSSASAVTGNDAFSKIATLNSDLSGKANSANFAVENSGRFLASGNQSNVELGIPANGYYAIMQIGDTINTTTFAQLAIGINVDKVYIRHANFGTLSEWVELH